MKTAIIVPVAAVTPMTIACLAACRQAAGNDDAIILLPDQPAELPPELQRDPRVRVVPTGEVTIAAKRNRALALAASVDACAFIDADAYPGPDWLTVAASVLRVRPDVGAVGGPNLSPPGQPWRRRAVGNALRSWLVTGMRTFRKRRAPPRDCADLPTVNLIVRRAAAVAIGGFDAGLETGEDIVFCARLLAAGWRIAYDPRVVVWHRDRPLFLPFIAQRLVYGLSVFRVWRATPGSRPWFLFLPVVLLGGLVTLPALALLGPAGWWPWLALVGSYSAAILGETVRCADRIRDYPATAAAILIGNLFPAAGILAAGIGAPVDIRRLYRTR